MSETYRDLYQDIILRHSRAPLHMRRLEPFDAAGYRRQSDVRRPLLKCACDFGTRTAAWIRWLSKARGCAIMPGQRGSDGWLPCKGAHTGIGAGNLARRVYWPGAQWRHCPANDAAIETLRPLSGVSEYPSRIKCATLPWAALIAALDGAGETSSE